MFNWLRSCGVIVGLFAIVGSTAGCGGNSPLAPSAPPPLSGPPASPPPVGPSTPPTVLTISPQPGSTGGGSSAILTGIGIEAGATLTIGGVVTASTFYGGTIYFLTPPHAAGTVDVVVTSAAGASATVPGGYTYVPPNSFDFNDRWEAAAHETPIRFVIRNNTVIELSCDTFAPFVFASPPQVVDGEFSYRANNGDSVTGRIVSASAATGTINFGSCRATTWYAFRYSTSQ